MSGPGQPALPPEAELRAFARIAARLLADPPVRAGGARAVRRRAGSGLEYLDHREYLDGDEWRSIDWRQSARFGRLIVRRTQADTANDWYLCLDASASMAAAGGAKWALATHCAAAMSYALLDMGHRVGLLVFADELLAACPAGRGASQFPRIARALGARRPASGGGGSRPGVCLTVLRGAASAFLISDFLAPDLMRRDLAALAGRCSETHALQILAREEIELPAIDHLVLVDCESGERLDCLATGTARAAAAAALDEATRELRAFCAGGAVSFSSSGAAIGWRAALVRHLGRTRAS